MFPKSANVKRVKHVKHINMLIPLTFRSSIKSFHRAAEHARRLLTDDCHSFVTRESMRGACSPIIVIHSLQGRACAAPAPSHIANLEDSAEKVRGTQIWPRAGPPP